MSEPQPYDDPFAGLFGNPSGQPGPARPSPATGPVRSVASPEPISVPPSFAPPAADSAAAEPAAPGSRRAARQAAARSTGEVPVAAPHEPQARPAAQAAPAVPATAFPVPIPGEQAPEASGFTPLPLRPVRTSYDFDDSAYVPTAADDPFSVVRDPSEPGPMRTPNGTSSPATHVPQMSARQTVQPSAAQDTPTVALPSMSAAFAPQRSEPTPTEAIAQMFAAEPAAASVAPPASTPSVSDSLFPTALVPRAETVPAPVTEAATPRRDSSFDDLFSDVAQPPSGGKGGGKGRGGGPRRGRVGGFVILGIVLVLIAGLVAGGMWAYNTYGGKIREVMGWSEPIDYESGKAHGEAIVEISEGDSGQIISESLAAAGVTKTPQAFYKMLNKLDTMPTFYPGVFKLQQEMTSAAALTALQDPKNKLEHTTIIPEGFTKDGTLARASKDLGIPLAELQAAAKNPAEYGVNAPTLEGWLFPARYDFKPDVKAPEVIKTMVDRTREALKKYDVSDQKANEILTIASIIQREARASADFKKVSRVIENRLKPGNDQTNGLLQMDSTAQYGVGELGDGAAGSSEKALKTKNGYNTYLKTGLPVGPISNPGEQAIDAAVHPVDGPWFYFTTVNLDTGKTVFSADMAGQEKAVAQLRAWCEATKSKSCYHG